MLFTQATAILEIIENTSGRLQITELLAQLFKQASADEVSILCNLSLGQLEPPYKNTQFNIAEKTAIKAVAQLLQLPPDLVTQQVKKKGDLGIIVALHQWEPGAQLTVEQVYEALVALQKMSGTGSQELKITTLQKLLGLLDPISAKFVVRIVIGKLRLGFSDMTLVDALSWMMVGDKSYRDSLENAFNICADIGYIARTLKQEGIEAVEQQQITIGIPIRPAGAERLPTAQAIFEKLGECRAQPKLDGFRLQIHLDTTQQKPFLKFFSRNLLDMSDMFPDLVIALQDLKVETLVAEGEAIGFDPNTKGFLRFQETVKRKRKHGIEQAAVEFPLKLFFFDVLYVDGHSVLDLPHVKRRELLTHILNKNRNSLLQEVEEKSIHSAQELEHYFHQTVEIGLEGLVVKRPDAIYQPGKRNFNWIKLKRQEEGHLEDTIDCVILGYYAGEGKRGSFGIGAFLVGVYNKEQDCFQTVAKIGTGLTDAAWIALKDAIDEYKTPEKPHNVDCPKTLEPDVWTIPQLVCLIRADEITLSPLHTAAKTDNALGYALRFPRVMGYRQDKGPYDVTTADEIKRLYEDQFIK